MFRTLKTCLVVMLALASSVSHGDSAASKRVKDLKITVLSTMLTERGAGEWGFAALVEADGHRILFDTGAAPDTVWRNANALGVDLAGVRDVVLTHHHGDHSGGLLFLREKFQGQGSDELTRLHVGQGIFWDRPYAVGWKHMREIRAEYEQLGGVVTEYDSAAELYPGIWLTGPVPRVHPEKNYGNPFRPGEALPKSLSSPEGMVEDSIPESLSMVINTEKGLVVLSGCGHAGMVNILEYSQQIVPGAPMHAAIGGFHLLNADDQHLAWTASKLRDLELEQFVGAHCTGLEPVYRFRALADFERSTSVVGAVGATFTLEDGIDPLLLAH